VKLTAAPGKDGTTILVDPRQGQYAGEIPSHYPRRTSPDNDEQWSAHYPQARQCEVVDACRNPKATAVAQCLPSRAAPAWNPPNQNVFCRTVWVSSSGRWFQPQRPGAPGLPQRDSKGRCDKIRRGDAERVGAPRTSTTRPRVMMTRTSPTRSHIVCKPMPYPSMSVIYP
jgi:hypothetical protein